MVFTEKYRCACLACSAEIIVLRRRGPRDTCSRCLNKQRIARWKTAHPGRHNELNRESRKRKPRLDTWQQRNPERTAERARRWRSANPDRAKEIERRWRAANHELAKAIQRAYYERNRATISERSQAKRLSDLERALERERMAYARNREVIAARRRGSWVRSVSRTPPWADREAMAALYREARRLTRETGIAHQVDHEIPLRGKLVSGLHVETNLRIITAEANRRKSARFTIE
jgi:hypothetical protein